MVWAGRWRSSIVGAVLCATMLVCTTTAGVVPLQPSFRSSVHIAADPSNTEWLRNYTTGVLKTCTITAADGTVLFTPDGTHAYGAQWTRDFAYMLMYGGDLIKAEYTQEVVRQSVQATMNGQRDDGCFPDRVQADGRAVYSPGPVDSPFADHAIDNQLFAVLMVDAYTMLWDDYAFFDAVRDRLDHGLAFVNVTADDGLVYNSDISPNCTYGFTDTVRKTGRLGFCSILLYQSLQAMGRMAAAAGKSDSTAYHTRAEAVAASLRTGPLYDVSTGMMLAAEHDCRQVDVWGSALAAQCGILDTTQATRVAQYLASNRGLYQNGQVRHLPPGEYWESCFGGGCPEHGTYQNGAFWATPLAWIVPVLSSHGHTTLASSLVDDALKDFRSGGVMEAVNDEKQPKYHGVPDYVSSATNAWQVAKSG